METYILLMENSLSILFIEPPFPALPPPTVQGPSGPAISLAPLILLLQPPPLWRCM